MVEEGALVCRQRRPGVGGAFELRARGRTGPLGGGEPFEGRLVGGDHAGTAAALDRHVADGHAALHRERADRRAGVLHDVSGHAADAEPAEGAEDQVLGGDPEAQLARVEDSHRAGLVLDHALGGEHVLDLAGADAEGERAEGAVGGGVGVAADDRHAGLGHAQLGADHVHDPLAVGAERVDGDAELVAVALERFDLHAGELVLDAGGHGRAVGGSVVVGGGEGAVGAAHLAPGQAQPVEGLGARDLVDEVQVDVHQAGALAGHLVGLPDLVEHRLRHLAPPEACRDESQEGGLGGRGVLEVVGQVGVEGHGVAVLQLVTGAVEDEHHAAALHECRLAASRLVDRRVIRRAGRATGRQRVAGELRALSGLGRGEHLIAMPAPRVATALAPSGAHDRDRALLVQSQQLRETQVEPHRDPCSDRQGRAGLAALHLGEHRR